MSERGGVLCVCFVLFVYRVSWPLGKKQDLMEMQTGERCLKVCKTERGVFGEEEQSSAEAEKRANL